MDFNDKQIQIITTAETLFAEKGFDGTSVRDIAEEAGINVAMISYYFGSKEKLMEALFELRAGKVRMRVEDLLKDESISPIEKVNLLIDEHIDRVMQTPAFHKIMVCVQLTNKNPVLLKIVNGVKVRNAEVVAELIKDGQKKGVFKKQIDIVMMLNTLIGTVSHTIMSQQYYRAFNRQQEQSEAAFQSALKRKLSLHIKNLFKAILTHEA